MHRFFITVLRGGIAMAILFGLFGQLVVIPTTAADEVDGFPHTPRTPCPTRWPPSQGSPASRSSSPRRGGCSP
ncbi:hypothetical protein WKI68_15785 [Streptomyces sp. MS1.HAVA.3]|uniref:Uncharacterized protein n=1 Tax=Streptomyces caledonius TaxID=3134107 RepID=A0ABU8U3M3_9ACTN